MNTDLAELGNEEFVEYCYRQLLGHPGDASGKSYWLAMLTAGQFSRLQIIGAFVASAEFQDGRLSPFVRFAIPGHFYSPLPSPEEVANYERLGKDMSRPLLAGIDLRIQDQLELLKTFAVYYEAQPFSDHSPTVRRYYFANDSFTHQDGLILYCFLRHFKPRQILEVGAGFSSAVMLDTNELFLDDLVNLSCVEPNPQRLLSLLRDSDKDKVRLMPAKVQDVPLSEFASLGENDILFVDSSHVVKFGSDVAFLLLEVLPALKPGVIIHFHDIFWPFEYPKDWLLEGRAWNEDYFIQAFLSFNSSFEILCFNSFLTTFYHDLLKALMPLAIKGPGGSLWMRKISWPYQA